MLHNVKDISMDQEIARLVELLGITRLQAYRQIKDREIIKRNGNRLQLSNMIK